MNGTIVVAGCGFVGEALAVALEATGADVVGLTHSEESTRRLAAVREFEVRTCDLGEENDVASLAGELASRGITVAAVVHCASSGRGGPDAYRRVFLEGAGHLADAFPLATLVFTSSTSVYPQTDGSVVDEASAAEPDRETGRLLRATEDRVLAAGGVVARLAGLYGPGRSVILKRFLEGAAVIDGDPDAEGEAEGRFLNQLHRDDAVSAIVHLLGLASAAGEVFNVVDDTPLTQRACYEGLARRFGRPVPGVAPPDPSRKRGWTHKRVSNGRLRATGWAPRYPSFLDALEWDPELVASIEAQVAGSTKPARKFPQ